MYIVKSAPDVTFIKDIPDATGSWVEKNVKVPYVWDGYDRFMDPTVYYKKDPLWLMMINAETIDPRSLERELLFERTSWYVNKPKTTSLDHVFDYISLNSILLPEYFLGVAVLCSIVWSTWVTKNSFNLMIQKKFSEVLGVLLLMVCFLYYNNLLFAYKVMDCSGHMLTTAVHSTFYKSVLNGQLALVAKFVIGALSGIYFFISACTLTEQRLTAPEYSLLIAFSMLGLLIVCSGNDLLTIYLAIELTSLTSYALASFKKTHCSSESGLKYFIVGSVSSSFFLLGSSLLYLETGSIYLEDFSCLFFFTSNHIPGSINFNLVDTALFFIFLSLFIKLACAPFHLWALNVYEESPTSSSFYFAAVTKLSIAVVIIKLAFHVFFKLCFCWVTFFIAIGVISALVGALGGIRQKKFKTLLAYSSTSNVGYGLIAVGGLTDTAAWAILFHVAIYQFTSLCTWALLLVTRLKFKIKTWKYSKEIADMSLLKNGNLPIGFSFAAVLFSLAGVPPLLGFEPKLFVLTDIIKSQYYLPGVFFVFCSLIAAFYYIRVVKTFFFENLPTGRLSYPAVEQYPISLSFLIHSLFYMFNDPTFLNNAFKNSKSKMWEAHLFTGHTEDWIQEHFEWNLDYAKREALSHEHGILDWSYVYGQEGLIRRLRGHIPHFTQAEIDANLQYHYDKAVQWASETKQAVDYKNVYGSTQVIERGIWSVQAESNYQTLLKYRHLVEQYPDLQPLLYRRLILEDYRDLKFDLPPTFYSFCEAPCYWTVEQEEELERRFQKFERDRKWCDTITSFYNQDLRGDRVEELKKFFANKHKVEKRALLQASQIAAEKKAADHRHCQNLHRFIAYFEQQTGKPYPFKTFL
jgi:NADH-quinone oxidoreductase subunit N